MQNDIYQNGNIIEEYEPFEEVSLRDYIRIILTKKWIVVVAFLAVVASSIFYVQTTEPIYEAKVLLMRNTTQEKLPLSILNLQNPISFSKEWDESSELLLRSRPLLAKVQERLKKDHNIILTVKKLEGEETLFFEQPRDASKMVQLIAHANTPDHAKVLANTAANTYIETVTKMKKSDISQGLKFLQKQMSQADKEISKTEKALSEFREKEELFITSSDTDSSGTGSSGLLERLGNLQSELIKTESKVELTKAQLDTINQKISAKKQDSNFSSSMISSPQIDKLRSKLMELKLELNTKLGTLTEKDPEVKNLKQQIAAAEKQLKSEFEKIRNNSEITAWNPVVELQNLIQQSITLDLELKGAKHKAALMKKRIEQFRKKHPEIAAKQVEYIKLKRQARVLEQNYIGLRQKYEEIRLLDQMKTNELELVDNASLPEFPIKPKKKLVILLGGILGIMLGVGTAFFLEYLDDSIKLKEDVERFLKLPIMGTIPDYEPFEIPEEVSVERKHKLSNATNPGSKNENGNDKESKRKKSKHKKGYRQNIKDLVSHSILYANEEHDSAHISESYQTLSANIRYANIDEPVKSILVTSAGPGEGKTSVVNNLGITMAKSGMKVLIVDSDLRRPRQHRIFQQDKAPGVTDFLTQEAEPANNQLLSDELSEEGLIRPTSVDNLYLFPAGSRVSNPGLLFSSEKIHEMVGDLSGQYDLVIFDSPPALSVADSVMLSNEIESTLLVVKSGETKQEMAVQAKESLEKVDANILGVILNDIDYSKQYGSYYYYYHSYGSHYYEDLKDEQEG